MNCSIPRRKFGPPKGSHCPPNCTCWRHRKNPRNERAPLAERFWSKVQKAEGCWQWIGGLTGDGYGCFVIETKKRVKAHRFAYEACIGPIPADLTLDHLCRNRRCVNPAHLDPVTNAENILRGEGYTAQAARRTHCPQGHPYDDENTYRQPCNGQRRCIMCMRERAKREWQEEKRKRGPIEPPLSCRHGHPYSPENTYITPGGTRQCRTCKKAAKERCATRHQP